MAMQGLTFGTTSCWESVGRHTFAEAQARTVKPLFCQQFFSLPLNSKYSIRTSCIVMYTCIYMLLAYSECIQVMLSCLKGGIIATEIWNNSNHSTHITLDTNMNSKFQSYTFHRNRAECAYRKHHPSEQEIIKHAHQSPEHLTSRTGRSLL